MIRRWRRHKTVSATSNSRFALRGKRCSTCCIERGMEAPLEECPAPAAHASFGRVGARALHKPRTSSPGGRSGGHAHPPISGSQRAGKGPSTISQKGLLRNGSHSRSVSRPGVWVWGFYGGGAGISPSGRGRWRGAALDTSVNAASTAESRAPALVPHSRWSVAPFPDSSQHRGIPKVRHAE